MLLNNFDICFDFMILSVKANKRPILSSLYVEHMVTGQRVYIVGMLYVDPMESSIGPWQSTCNCTFDWMDIAYSIYTWPGFIWEC